MSKRTIGFGLLAAVVGMMLVGGLEVAAAEKRNQWFEFCTTKAYGWPLPWRVDYCACEKSRKERSRVHAVVNVGLILAGGVGGFLIVGGGACVARRSGGEK
ncbi:MAG: hypothetical protein AAF591_16835 [Verrucomicrobiota bacterium]